MKSRHAIVGIGAGVAGLWVAGVAIARQTEPAWARGVFSLHGTDTPVWDAVVWDDGGGPALYVGGQFTIAGEAASRAIVSFDGHMWSGLGEGFGGSRPDVRALAVFDDGSGPALYVGGNFEQVGGEAINGIARWDGSQWDHLGGAGVSGFVQAVAVFDDGDGPAIYVGGSFATVDQAGSPISVNGVARWDGQNWSALVGPDGTPGVIGGRVHAMAVHDDGSGPALYVGGEFNSAGGESVNGIARWDGQDWSRVFLGTNGPVYALAEYDAGEGARLYAGGQFVMASGIPASNIAQWDGVRWSAVMGPLGEGVMGYDEPVGMLEVADLGDGPVLLVGGHFRSAGGIDAWGIAQWDGTTWSDLDGGVLGRGVLTDARAAVVFDAGAGRRLFVGGFFDSAGTASAENLAQWDGSAWDAVPSGQGMGLPREGEAIAVFDDGSGPALVVAGEFERINGVEMNGIARWDGASWAPLAGGIGDVSMGTQLVNAMAAFDDGSGPALYVGGGMLASRDAPADYIARWLAARGPRLAPGSTVG